MSFGSKFIDNLTFIHEAKLQTRLESSQRLRKFPKPPCNARNDALDVVAVPATEAVLGPALTSLGACLLGD